MRARKRGQAALARRYNEGPVVRTSASPVPFLIGIAAFLGILALAFKNKGAIVTGVTQAGQLVGQAVDQAKVAAFNAALQLTQRWVPLFAPLTSNAGNRSADLYRRVCAQFNVTSSPRYAASPGVTWCNIYVWDATSAMSAEVPHWYDPATGAATSVGRGVETRANDVYNWLVKGFGGWREGTYAEAVANAALGRPSVAAYFNPTPGRSGHVAMVLPNGNIAQAGAHNYFDVPVKTGFGSLPVRYFLHA